MTKCACKTDKGKNCKNACETGKTRCRSHRGKKCSPRSGKSSAKGSKSTTPRKYSPRSYGDMCGCLTEKGRQCKNKHLPGMKHCRKHIGQCMEGPSRK